MIHGKSKHVRLHEHFHLLNPVNATIEGSSMCFNVTELDFEILMNGSLIFLESGTIVDIERFCINSVAGQQGIFFNLINIKFFYRMVLLVL
jgi:hypothetical protein